MDLEQSIHHANSIEVTVTQGETTRWTSFIVEAEGNRLEFTAFGDLPLRFTHLENDPVENVAGELAALRSVIQVRDPAPADPDHIDVLKMSEFRLNRARKAEAACNLLRDEIADMGTQLHGFRTANTQLAADLDAKQTTNEQLTGDLDDVVVSLNEFKSANDKLAENVSEWSDRCNMLESQLADVNQELVNFRNEAAARGDA